jgi:hypothetical protein
MRNPQFFVPLVSASLVAALAGCADGSDGPMDEMDIGDTDGEDTADEDPSAGDPSGGGSGGGNGDDSSGDDSSGDDSSGDDSSDDDSDGTTGDPVDDEDLDPPVIVSVSPADGDAGVREDAPIVITFSEPMNKASTQVAYSSIDLPSAAVTMSWNDAGDVLTIQPNEVLEYAQGPMGDIDDLEAFAYAFSLSTAATDRAGNELEAGADVEFTTLREVYGALSTVSEMSATLSSEDAAYVGVLAVGDYADGSYLWGLTSLSIAELPEGIVEFSSAQLRLEQYSTTAINPFGDEDLGVVHLHDVEFADPMASFDVAMGPEVGVLASGAATELLRTMNVVDQMAADYYDGDTLTQFGIRFTETSDTDGETEGTIFNVHGEIWTTFLLP